MLPPSWGFALSAPPVVSPPPPLELLLLLPPPHAAAAISTSARMNAVIRGLVRDAAGFSTCPPGLWSTARPLHGSARRSCDGPPRTRRSATVVGTSARCVATVQRPTRA